MLNGIYNSWEGSSPFIFFYPDLRPVSLWFVYQFKNQNQKGRILVNKSLSAEGERNSRARITYL